MADYIYLLENRLSAAQQAALKAVREVARTEGITVFLVGGAVRDLTSGSPVRDLDVAVQGNALKLKKQIELVGGVVTGEAPVTQAIYVSFPGGVRVEVGSTLTLTYPKPGKAVAKPATILEDLRRRDFTANAMALSLNDGSYGLLMDPLNGVADIENRQLRLVSNYGFIEEPVRMIRAVRFQARLGWAMDEKTRARYDNGKADNSISTLNDFYRGYETEEIFHEEDPLRVLRKLEEEGWMKVLFPALTVAKANSVELERLREAQTQLQMRGIYPEAAAANFPLVTAKLSASELAELKRSFVRPGFVTEVERLEGEAKAFATQLTSKAATQPSDSYKLIDAAKPEAMLWLLYTSKNAGVQAKLKSFLTEWPQARTKIPYTLMQEMRIVPDLPIYGEVVEKLFFELVDGRLGTVEEMKAWLETYSPPAPPPPVHLRRPRAAKKDAKGAKSRKKAAAIIDPVDEDELDHAPVQDGDEGEESAKDEHQGEADEPAKTPVPADSSHPEPEAVTERAPATQADVVVTPRKPEPAKMAPAKVSPAKVPAKQPSTPSAKHTAASPRPAALSKQAAAKAAPADKSSGKTAPAAAKSPVAAKVAVPVKAPVAARSRAAVPQKKPAPAKAPVKKVDKRSHTAVRGKVSPPAARAAVPAKKAALPAKKVVPVKKAVAKKAAAAAGKTPTPSPKKATAKAQPGKAAPAKKVAAKTAKKPAPAKRR